MIYRHFKDIIKYLAILALGLFIVLVIRFSPEIYSTTKPYFDYRSETKKLSKAQSMDVYFDDQLKQDIPPQDIPLYASEIRDVTLNEIHWQSACPFTIKLVFAFPDKSTYDVFIGTDGCKQIRLPSGLQSSFSFDGKLAELEKEYREVETAPEETE